MCPGRYAEGENLRAITPESSYKLEYIERVTKLKKNYLRFGNKALD